ncbi:MAG: MoaD/ThiS family protein [Chloroflexi bacterium]|nr:MoaD/ThiS family protein [Chloroflexota bacterium]
MADIIVDVWLYGALARHRSEANQGGFANLQVSLPEGSTMSDLLAHLRVHSEERGVTFINGQLSAMPGLQPDLGHVLHNGDRVGLFDPVSMWPFQYRFGAAMTEEMAQAMAATRDHGLHHAYDQR